MRITRPQMFMEIARTVSKRAICFRLSVGAVIVAKRSIVSIGYNGVPPGEPHCTGNDCPGKHGCHLTTHAEINALTHLPGSVGSSLDLYVTDSPCSDCYSKIVIDGRVDRIFFEKPYRVNDHLLRDEYGIKVYQLTPSGYLMDFRTKELVEIDT